MIVNIISKSDYGMWKVILNDSLLIRNRAYVSDVFKIGIEKVEAVIDEFHDSGCVIIQSKINFKNGCYDKE
jgi:hypothetical protein